jgi:hypothetical protein
MYAIELEKQQQDKSLRYPIINCTSSIVAICVMENHIFAEK